MTTGDYDSGADAWFMSIKGTKGQKAFEGDDGAISVLKYFKKNKIMESVELDEVSISKIEASLIVWMKQQTADIWNLSLLVIMILELMHGLCLLKELKVKRHLREMMVLFQY